MLRLRETVEGVPTSKGSLSAAALPLTCPHCEQKIPPNVIRHTMLEKKSSASRARLAAWTEALGYTLNKYRPDGIVRGKYLQPLSVAATFYMPRPKGARKYAIRPTTMPDIDKLCRVVLDALTGRGYIDDRQVVELNALEYYATELHPAGVELEVRQV